MHRWRSPSRGRMSRWSEMPPRQRRAIAVVAIVQVALLLAALRDIRRRPSDEIRGPKLLWVLVSFVNFVGPLSYFKFGRVASKEREPATV